MFVAEELDILMEALDVWEKEPTSSAVFAGFLGSMLASGDDKKNVMEEALQEPKREVAIRKRRVIRLKAKLLDMGDDSLAERLFTDANLTNPAE